MGYDIPGQLLVLIAFAFNIIACFAFFRLARGDTSYETLALRAYRLFTISVTLAVVYLFYLFLSHNFTNRYVFEYSDRSLPFFYLLSAFWGGQEGSWLLWVFLNALCGYFIIRKGGRYRDYGMAIYAVINVFFLLILVRLSPFALLAFPTTDGAGLNPLLQDPWMVIHPPVIFAGYALTAVPFAIAITALIINDYSVWVKRAFPWVVLSSLMLGAGNIMGAFWAYGTLGWGGFWGWDPVENSSLIPWLVSLALMHGMIVERRTGGLRRSNILMTICLFVIVIYGTFLTRSGVLADFSVHSFVDLGTNVYLVGFLLLLIIASVLLFIWRIRSLRYVPLNYNFYNRDFSMVLSTALFFLFSMIVLFWTSLPFVTSIFSAEPSAAAPATYNNFGLPIAILFSLLLVMSPYTARDDYYPKVWKKKLLVVATMTATIGIGLFRYILHSDLIFTIIFVLVITGLLMFLMKPRMAGRLFPAMAAFAGVVILSLMLGVSDYYYVFFFAMAAMAVVANLLAVVDRLPGRWKSSGGQLAHFGFGVMLIGILASSAFTSSERLILTKNESSVAFDLGITYKGMEHDIMQAHNELILTVDDGNVSNEITPRLYYSQRLNGMMKTPVVRKSLLEDIYFAPQQVMEAGEQEGFRLLRGETKSVSGYRITFCEFSMDQHHESGANFTVAAMLEVEHGDVTDTLVPALELVTDSAGHSRQIEHPAFLDQDQRYRVFLTKVFANEGAVLLTIPGLIGNDTAEQLILDVSKKPLINFLWGGATLILIGCLVVFIRRQTA